MHLLVVSATLSEVKPVFEHLNERLAAGHHYDAHSPLSKGQLFRFSFSAHTIDMLITGPGMMHTAYYLGRILLTRQPEVCINAGIAGAFDGNLQPGDVVQVTEEQMADTGAEAKQDFYDGFELGLFNEDEPPFTDKRLLNNTSTCHALFANLSLKKGLTVNKVHGRGDSIRQVHTKFQADVESMEGAAFFFCCLMNNLPFYEIRAVSNYVEPRNKERWHIRKAIRNLNKELIECLHQFTN